MSEPAWIAEARKHIGLAEIPGPKNNATIAGWLARLHAWWSDDATPWCGVYVAAVLEPYFPLPKHWYRARAWLEWGVKLEHPEVGCVVVFERGAAGHVGFVVGRDRQGDLLVLGGNQGDAVSIAAFHRGRVLGYRWPANVELVAASLPLGSANSSGSEA
jgi:uncharacterized protein (TIGR02594 family)